MFAVLGPHNEPGPIEPLDVALFRPPEDKGELAELAAVKAAVLTEAAAPIVGLVDRTRDEIGLQRERMLLSELELLWTSTKFHRVPLAPGIDGIHVEMGSGRGNAVNIGLPDVPRQIGGLPTDTLEDQMGRERDESGNEIDRRERNAPRDYPDERER